MNNEHVRNQKESDPVATFFWLLVGLAPIPILLSTVTLNWLPEEFGLLAILGCALCNLIGGFGCFGSIKNGAVRVILGLFLAAIFFVLSWGITLFIGCSHGIGIGH
jgi:hypothetical protein